jgi:hypothetical protein
MKNEKSKIKKKETFTIPQKRNYWNSRSKTTIIMNTHG